MGSERDVTDRVNSYYRQRSVVMIGRGNNYDGI